MQFFIPVALALFITSSRADVATHSDRVVLSTRGQNKLYLRGLPFVLISRMINSSFLPPPRPPQPPTPPPPEQIKCIIPLFLFLFFLFFSFCFHGLLVRTQEKLTQVQFQLCACVVVHVPSSGSTWPPRSTNGKIGFRPLTVSRLRRSGEKCDIPARQSETVTG